MHSINKIKGKNEILSNLINQQNENNQTADKYLKKQVKIYF